MWRESENPSFDAMVLARAKMRSGGTMRNEFIGDHDSKPMVWAGRILSGLAVLFLLMDGVGKLVKPAPVIEATTALGWSEGSILTLGVLVLIATALYVIPRTAILGAILLTGFLGGAVASQLRIGNPLFSHTLFPVYIGVMVWVGLWLRHRQLRGLLFQ
jgi:DoxX-like family